MLTYNEEGYTYLYEPLIKWWEDNYQITIWYAGTGMWSHLQKFDCQLAVGDTIIFEKGDTYFQCPNWIYFDKPEELVRIAIELFTIKPEDTDADYFDSYKPEQLVWLQTVYAMNLEYCKEYFPSEFYTGYNSSLDSERE